MLSGHHVIYNVHALNRVLKRVDMPDAALGVAEDERHSSVEGVVFYPKQTFKIVQPELATKSFEYSQIDGFADPLSQDDFPKSFDIGAAIPEIGGY